MCLAATLTLSSRISFIQTGMKWNKLWQTLKQHWRRIATWFRNVDANTRKKTQTYLCSVRNGKKQFEGTQSSSSFVFAHTKYNTKVVTVVNVKPIFFLLRPACIRIFRCCQILFINTTEERNPFAVNSPENFRRKKKLCVRFLRVVLSSPTQWDFLPRVLRTNATCS